jgi:hypothetical protein
MALEAINLLEEYTTECETYKQIAIPFVKRILEKSIADG